MTDSWHRSDRAGCKNGHLRDFFLGVRFFTVSFSLLRLNVRKSESYGSIGAIGSKQPEFLCKQQYIFSVCFYKITFFDGI